MPNNDADFDRSKAEMVRLTAPDVLGFYTHFEATEIFAVRDGEHAPLNVFSIMVAEERAGAAETKPDYLGSRIRLKSLKGWMFGIQRFIRPISELEHAFEHFHQTGVWRPSGEQLRVGPLTPAPTQFRAAGLNHNCSLE
jgi:hypothetical protein